MDYSQFSPLDIFKIFAPIIPALPFVGPALTVILIGYLSYGPSRLRIPATVPGIPLALTSIALAVLAGALGILNAFQNIASQKATGIRALARSIAETMHVVPTAIVLSVGCVAALAMFQVIRDRHDEGAQFTSTTKWAVPRTTLLWSLVSAVVIMGLLLFFQQSIDLILLVADPARRSEADIRLGQTSITELSAMISHRVIWSGIFAFAISAFLVHAAQRSLQVGEVSSWIRKYSWPVTIIVTVGIISSSIAYYRELRYLASLTNVK